MKTKNSSFGKAFLSKKRFALVKIAIVLCSVFLVAIPAIAADQNQAMQKVSASEVTTASEDDYVLDIYGNANEDDTIDMGDVVYIKLAIFGKKPKTELCDAKYDGRINVLDVIQTKLIILGKEKELTVIDTLDRIVTVKKPVERLVACYMTLEMIRSLKVGKDRIVGVHYTIQQDNNIVFFPEYQDKPTIASEDPESVLKLRPDLVIVIAHSGWKRVVLKEACEAAGIPVFFAWCGCRGLLIVEEAEKLGYILDKKDEAAEFIDWYEGAARNPVIEKVKEIPEEDKPKVYFESGRYRAIGEVNSHIARTGGKDIFEGKGGKVDPEAVARLNPDIILMRRAAIGGYGIDDTTEFKDAREELMSRPELQNVKAVKTGKVYVISSYITSYMRPAAGKQFILDAYQAKWFNPTYFDDMDPKTIHQEYLTRFQGLDIDLDEKGVFVYHPEEHPDGN
jgi:iron complex transport system substrate-binding protein